LRCCCSPRSSSNSLCAYDRITVTKTCTPESVPQGETVTCTVTIENKDFDHGVKNLTVTNQVPFPGGPTTPVAGCSASLEADDGVDGSGTDSPAVVFKRWPPSLAQQLTAFLTDEVRVAGLDNAPGTGFDNLPVSGSASNTVIVTPLTCDDSNACTTDTCVPATGCKYTADVVCDDSNACTTDTCVPRRDVNTRRMSSAMTATPAPRIPAFPRRDVNTRRMSSA